MGTTDNGTHQQQIDPGTWYDDHPQSPEQGAIPLLEVIIWQLQGNRGLIRTYNFNYSCINDREQSQQMGKFMTTILNLLVKGMAQIGILTPLTDEEIAQHRTVGGDRRLH